MCINHWRIRNVSISSAILIFFYSAGQITLASESNFGAGSSANIDSNLGITAKNTALDFIKGLDDMANIIGILPGPSSWGLIRSFKYILYYMGIAF